MAVPNSNGAAAQTPDALEKIRNSVRQSTNAYAQDRGIELMIPAIVAAAEKP